MRETRGEKIGECESERMHRVHTRANLLPLHHFLSSVAIALTILIRLPQYHVSEACRDRGQW